MTVCGCSGMWKVGGCDLLRRGVIGSCDAVAVPWVACSSNVRRLLAGSIVAVGDSPGIIVCRTLLDEWRVVA